jgi:hypothetical protein
MLSFVEKRMNESKGRVFGAKSFFYPSERLLLHKKLVLEGSDGDGGRSLGLHDLAGLGLGGQPLERHLDA